MNGMMKSLYIEDNVSINLKDIPIPQPSNGQVLIKVEYAPVNPFDKEFLNGYKIGQKQLVSTVPGFEGSGTVIASGGGLLGWQLKGNRVAFYTEHQFGAYGQYAIADVNYCAELPKNITFQEGCCSFINPMSVLMMYQLLGNASGIVSTGACTNIGRMLMRYCQSKGINVINIVKSQGEEKLLKDEGAKLILNINQEDFDEKLKLMSSSYNTTVLFDSIGGDQLSRILNLMPNNSRTYLYANYSKKSLEGIYSANLMYQNKKIFGFSFVDILQSKNIIQLKLMMKEILNNIQGCFKTLPTQIFSLEEFEKALESKEKAILKI
ncbi:unnamed protein product [Paramecium pentaurelia]|uniref:Enoyl reductase (ER) domain-containing protein n=1 Tax=Paramecium pentaurelia TaxID=43138 RepID=A0A8S1TU42_9CILI|nr:unnamed protein product [Paramecium pentaurelia]